MCRWCCLCLWEWRYHHGRPRLSQWQVKVDHHQWAPQHWQWHLRDDWIWLSSPCHDHQMMREVWPEWVVCVSPKHFYLQLLTNQRSVFKYIDQSQLSLYLLCWCWTLCSDPPCQHTPASGARTPACWTRSSLQLTLSTWSWYSSWWSWYSSWCSWYSSWCSWYSS